MKPIITQQKDGTWIFQRLRFNLMNRKTHQEIYDNNERIPTEDILEKLLSDFHTEHPEVREIRWSNEQLAAFHVQETFTFLWYAIKPIAEKYNIRFTLSRPNRVFNMLLSCNQNDPRFEVEKIQAILQNFPHQSLDKVCYAIACAIELNYLYRDDKDNTLELIPLLPRDETILNYLLKHLMLLNFTHPCFTQPFKHTVIQEMESKATWCYKNLMFMSEHEWVETTQESWEVIAALYNHFKHEKETLIAFHIRLTTMIEHLEKKYVLKNNIEIVQPHYQEITLNI